MSAISVTVRLCKQFPQLLEGGFRVLGEDYPLRSTNTIAQHHLPL